MKLEKVKCNLCGSNEEKILFATGYGNIVKCRNCGLVYRNPRLPENRELERYICSDLIREPNYDQINLSKEKIFRNTLKKILHFTPPALHLPPRLLDIGCSDGFFLQLAEEYGFDVYGVEVSKLAVNIAKKKFGERIFAGTLKQAKFPDNYFDAITLWDVLDHFYDPLVELNEVKRVLKKEGCVLIRVRNKNFHIPIQRIGENFAGRLALSPTVFHLYSFSAETIKTILGESGFQKIKIYNSPMTIADPYSGGKIFGKLGMQLLKYFVYLFCQIIYYSSRKKLILAPSMLVSARK